MQERELLARGRVTVFKSTDIGDEEKDMNNREDSEYAHALEEVAPDADFAAEVNQGVGFEASGHEYYGNGTWDRVPWKISVYSGFKVPCKGDLDSMKTANFIARELALEHAKDAMGEAMATHITDIRERLFVGLFNG